MNLTVLVEEVSKDRFRASTTSPISLQAEGESRDEAIQRLQEVAAQRIDSGEIVEISVPERPKNAAWLKARGLFKDHPDFDQFLENIKEYRQQANEVESAS